MVQTTSNIPTLVTMDSSGRRPAKHNNHVGGVRARFTLNPTSALRGVMMYSPRLLALSFSYFLRSSADMALRGSILFL